MSQSTTGTGTAAPTPAASIRGDDDDADNRPSPWNNRPPRRRREAGSAGTGGFAIPEGKVNTLNRYKKYSMLAAFSRTGIVCMYICILSSGPQGIFFFKSVIDYTRGYKSARMYNAYNNCSVQQVVVWDETMQQMVVKDRDDVKLKVYTR